MKVKVPSSKSLAHRYLIAAALSDGNCEVLIDGWSKDLIATRDCLAAMKRGDTVWPCGESGTTLRLLSPIAAVMGWRGEFKKEGRLKDRPMLPFERKDRYVVPGNISSQFVSGLLMALPLADWNSEIVIDGELQSASYVGLTEAVLRESGIVVERIPGEGVGWRIHGGQHYALSGRIEVEGDWSSAAAWLAMGVEVEGLNRESRQGDRKVVEFIKAIDAANPSGTIDIADTPDLYPVLATYAEFTGKQIRFLNCERLRLKESDRIESTARMIECVKQGKRVCTFNDHRIAMSAALAAVLLKRPVMMDDPRCVAKSYPRFWEDFHRLFPELSATGRLRCGLLGRKLGHSKSPSIHRMFGDYEYRLFEREPEEVESFIRDGEWDVINVTIPYKKTVFELCDEISDVARILGNVNLVEKRVDADGKARIIGDNTDAFGFLALLNSVAGGSAGFAGRKVLVLGSGGAGSTALRVLQSIKANVVVISRNGPDNYDNLDRHADAEAIVNATPVGMFPNENAMPVDLTMFPNLKNVVDLVYNPSPTKLVREARNRGISAVDGLAMLVAQAWKASISRMGGNLGERNIYFYGPPGSGKTTLARSLSKIVNVRLVDLDVEIEREAGRSISDIFAQSGEQAFRALEKRVFAMLAMQRGVMVSLGGGTLLDAESESLARETGRIVLITASDEELWNRVSKTTKRPLAREKEQFMRLLENRREHYRKFE